MSDHRARPMGKRRHEHDDHEPNLDELYESIEKAASEGLEALTDAMEAAGIPPESAKMIWEYNERIRQRAIAIMGADPGELEGWEKAALRLAQLNPAEALKDRFLREDDPNMEALYEMANAIKALMLVMDKAVKEES